MAFGAEIGLGGQVGDMVGRLVEGAAGGGVSGLFSGGLGVYGAGDLLLGGFGGFGRCAAHGLRLVCLNLYAVCLFGMGSSAWSLA